MGPTTDVGLGHMHETNQNSHQETAEQSFDHLCLSRSLKRIISRTSSTSWGTCYLALLESISSLLGGQGAQQLNGTLSQGGILIHVTDEPRRPRTDR